MAYSKQHAKNGILLTVPPNHMVICSNSNNTYLQYVLGVFKCFFKDIGYNDLIQTEMTELI